MKSLFHAVFAAAVLSSFGLLAPFASADSPGGEPILLLADGPSGPEKSLADTATLAGAVLLSTVSTNGLTVNIYSKDPDGIGFRQGTARLDRLEEALAYIADVLNESGEVDLMLGLSEYDGSGALAQGGPLFANPPGNGAVYERIASGTKPFPGYAEMVLTFDWGWNWNDSIAPPATDRVDLRSVMLHEITHGLGFITFVGSTGASTAGAGMYTDFDLLLAAGNPAAYLVSGGVFVGNAANLTDNSVVFAGASAASAFGGTYPAMYSPAPFASGSSLQHWAEGAVPGGAVMEHAYVPGAMKRTYSGVDLGALKDLGYVGATASPNYGACPLASVALQAPDTQTATGSSTTVKVACSASVVFNTTEDCLPTKNVRVTYSVNGETKGVSTNYDGGFPVQISLGEGVWTLTATAERQDGMGAPVMAQKTLTAVVPARLQVSPASGTVDFGETEPSAPVEKAFTVTNSGGGTLTGVASLSGDEVFAFAGASDFSLTAGQTTQIVVRLTPGKKGGDYSGTVRFTSGELAPVELSLTGVGLRTGFLNCAGGARSVSYGPDVLVAVLAVVAMLLGRRVSRGRI